jgi:hypothetical protein
VEFVRTHDTGDLVLARLRVEPGEVGEEAGDLEDQVGAGAEHEVAVAGGLVVLPNGVRDGQADVALVGRPVGHPVLRAWVVQLGRGLVAAVASALPGEHRSAVAGGAGGFASLVEAAVPVAQQSPARLRQVQSEDSVDEQLVPEDMSPIALAVQAAGAHPHIAVDDVGRRGGQDVKYVQAQQRSSVLATYVDRAPAPQRPPRADVVA